MSALDSAFLGTAVVPLFLVLGGLPLPDSSATSELEATSATTTESSQDEADGGQPGAPAVLDAQAGEDAPPDVAPSTAPGFDPELEDDYEAPHTPESSLNGYINLRWRSRWAEDAGDDDHDVYGVAGVDFVTAGANPWGVHVLLRGSWGVNGQDPDSLFYGVQDTHSNRIDARVYHAYVDMPFGDGLQLARLGRMLIYDTPATAYFDGGAFESAPNGPTQVSFGIYGGNSVHLQEAWPSDEWMGGLYTKFRPWVDGQFRFDWMRLNDDARFGEGENDLVSTKLNHRFGDNSRLEANYSWLDGRSNDARLKGFFLWPEQDATLQLTVYSLLREQRNFAYELNPYYNIMRTYFPYNEGQLVFSKAFSETLDLYAGVDTRRVDDEGDIGRFNRDFDRYYLTMAFPELLPLNTTLSLTGEIWDSPDNDIQTWGIDFTSRLDGGSKVSLGSYYSLYKYFFDINTERENVRTFYAEFRNPITDSTDLLARYEYENEPIDTFHSMRLGVTWRF